VVPVVIIADLIAAGLHLGWSVLRRPTMPDTWGHAIEVPDKDLYEILLLSDVISYSLLTSV